MWFDLKLHLNFSVGFAIEWFGINSGAEFRQRLRHGICIQLVLLRKTQICFGFTHAQTVNNKNALNANDWSISLPYPPFCTPLNFPDVFPDRCKDSETSAIHSSQCLFGPGHTNSTSELSFAYVNVVSYWMQYIIKWRMKTGLSL